MRRIYIHLDSHAADAADIKNIRRAKVMASDLTLLSGDTDIRKILIRYPSPQHFIANHIIGIYF